MFYIFTIEILILYYWKLFFIQDMIKMKLRSHQLMNILFVSNNFY